MMAAAAVLLSAAPSHAESNDLDGSPAVRRQFMMRSDRIELSGSVGSTFAEVYQQTALLGLGGRYYINDSFAAGLQLDIGTIAFPTNLTSNFEDADGSLPSSARRADKVDYAIPRVSAGVEVQYVPWVGKLNLLESKIIRFDLAAQLGLGGSLRSSDSEDLAGFKFGPSAGVTLRVFLSDNTAVHLRVTDYLYTAADARFEDDELDESFGHHFVSMVGFSYFLPATVKLSK
jgi:outer membrane beta-barrel protein